MHIIFTYLIVLIIITISVIKTAINTGPVSKFRSNKNSEVLFFFSLPVFLYFFSVYRLPLLLHEVAKSKADKFLKIINWGILKNANKQQITTFQTQLAWVPCGSCVNHACLSHSS